MAKIYSQVKFACDADDLLEAELKDVPIQKFKISNLDELKNTLSNFNGIVLQDDIENNIYPMAINAEGKNEVFVGRIRRDYSVKSGINMWVVADNIRKGAATNAVQILEKLIKR